MAVLRVSNFVGLLPKLAARAPDADCVELTEVLQHLI